MAMGQFHIVDRSVSRNKMFTVMQPFSSYFLEWAEFFLSLAMELMASKCDV